MQECEGEGGRARAEIDDGGSRLSCAFVEDPKRKKKKGRRERTFVDGGGGGGGRSLIKDGRSESVVSEVGVMMETGGSQSVLLAGRGRGGGEEVEAVGRREGGGAVHRTPTPIALDCSPGSIPGLVECLP